MGYWSGIKVFYGPRLVGFWLNLAAGDTLEHCKNPGANSGGKGFSHFFFYRLSLMGVPLSDFYKKF